MELIHTCYRITDPERSIAEVLGTPGHVHYRVRWDDGGESIFYPGSDATIRHAHGGRPRGGSR